MVQKIAFTLFLLITLALKAEATAYYLRGKGDDTKAGTSPKTAWRSLTRASAQTFQIGRAHV